MADDKWKSELNGITRRAFIKGVITAGAVSWAGSVFRGVGLAAQKAEDSADII
jgi:hypothetical protein